jgi:glycosyltransferase involved in cell wall biosynthesis
MKVFFVNTNKKWGGGEKWHLDTACYMNSKGHEVAILTLRGKDLFNRASQAGIRVIPVFVSNLSFLNPFRVFKIMQLLRKEKPDVLILNLPADLKIVGIAAKLTGIQNIIYRRGSAIPIRNSMINRILFNKIIKLVITNSHETRRTILEKNKSLLPEEKIKVIYNGISLHHFDRLPVYELYQRKGNEILIGNAGRLDEGKGQKYLVDIAQKLCSRKIDFKILVAGEGPQESTLKQLSQKAGMENRIIFLGFVDNMKAFMENIDIFAFTSLSEGFGYVLIEAMACKKPVVAFNNSSIPEIVMDNITGLHVNNTDIDDFIVKMLLLINDPGFRESLGYAGRKRVEEFFNLDVIQNTIEGLLSGLVRQNS